ncbi:hypothetical protein BDF19DRAFT_456941 [Syncephalis fuscata]|nr:hypothetical protein BDF19DRAFT_456941 [Syncephalis fuscata]
MELNYSVHNTQHTIGGETRSATSKIPPRLSGIRRSFSEPTDIHQAASEAIESACWSPAITTPPLTPCAVKDDDDDAVNQMLDASLVVSYSYRKRRLSTSNERPLTETKQHIVHFNEQHWFRDAESYLMKSRRRSGLPNIFNLTPIPFETAQPHCSLNGISQMDDQMLHN